MSGLDAFRAGSGAASAARGSGRLGSRAHHRVDRPSSSVTSHMEQEFSCLRHDFDPHRWRQTKFEPLKKRKSSDSQTYSMRKAQSDEIALA
eukprot:6183108-Pleurochrysis_carterae.AAC.1